MRSRLILSGSSLVSNVFALFSDRRYLRLTLSCLPGLVLSRRRRDQFTEIRTFCRQLPAMLEGPLPEAMTRLTPDTGNPHLDEEDDLRNMVDLVVWLESGSPLGLCLRRSLTRYYFLRQVGVPLEVHFGARFNELEANRALIGHAWLTSNGQPYYEAEADYRGFTVMFSWSPDESKGTQPFA